MRVFGVRLGGVLSEYRETPFRQEHDESVLEGWLESSPDAVLEDGGILVVGRQVSTSLGGFVDLLGVDREGNTVVVELKRGRTPRETVAQALEYASDVGRLDAAGLEGILRAYLRDESVVLAEHHREHFALEAAEAVAFNKDQRIVVVGQPVGREIRQTASFLRSKGVSVTCVELSLFQDGDGALLLSQQVVVGEESDRTAASVVSAPRAAITEEEFLASCDENGRLVFSRVLDLARKSLMPVRWGSKGFSLNADLGGTHVAVCFGYPPGSVYGQSVCTGLRRPGGVAKKIAVPDETIEALYRRARQTGLFEQAGRELRWRITQKPADSEIGQLLDWCLSAEKQIREHGPSR
ncbi:MAG: endonuclease NucS [Actinomycetia bacterium]|nr:endonuclease NucS [Actinomycetes bacterium]